MAEEPGLRERKKAQTKRALAEAAHGLFLKRGFDATKIEDITAAANVSRRTFFRYFPSKEAVVFPAYHERLDLFRAQLTPQEGESTIDAIRRACVSIASEFMTHRKELLMQQRIIESSTLLIAYELKLDREWEIAIAEVLGAQAETDKEKRKYRMIAGAIMGLVRALFREWFAGDCQQDLFALGEEGFLGLLQSLQDRE